MEKWRNFGKGNVGMKVLVVIIVVIVLGGCVALAIKNCKKNEKSDIDHSVDKPASDHGDEKHPEPLN